MEPSTWLNGLPVAGIEPSNRAMAYGDGLFETIAVCNGRARLLLWHLERLASGCKRLGIALDAGRLSQELTAAVPVGGHGVVKIVIARAGAGRGYAAPAAAQGERLLRWLPAAMPPLLGENAAVPVRLCRQRLALQPRLAGLKHLNRLEQVLARAEWRDPAIVEGLMLDTAGHLIEGVSSNLFLVAGGRLLTPRLDQCGVAGVMRRLIIERLAPAADLVVEEARLSLADFYRADELFLTSSLIGIRPVTRVDCFALARTRLGQQLQRLLVDWQGAGLV